MPTIMIIEDDEPTRTLLHMLLKNEYHVILAEDGVMALRILNEQTPDLILLDIMMPKIGGIETCRRIRANEMTADIPIIMLTALSGVDDKVDAFEVGADDYITKPVHQAELKSRIKVQLARQRRKQAT